MQKGLFSDDSGIYYLTAHGMETKKWVNFDDKTYYFGEDGEVGEPVEGKNAVGAVIQPHGFLAAAGDAEEFGHPEFRAVEVQFGLQIQPVDAEGADGEGLADRASVGLSLGGDFPAGEDERAHRAVQPCGKKFPAGVLVAALAGDQPETELSELVAQAFLGGEVAFDDPTAGCGQPRRGIFAVCADDSRVVEGECALKLLLPEVLETRGGDVELADGIDIFYCNFFIVR